MTAIEVPPGYRAHDPDSLKLWAAGVPAVVTAVGGGPGDWRVEEVGDGNLNLVFKLRGPAGGVAVKQALPYVRLVGESWPLPLSRAHYEHMALTTHARHAPGLVPDVLHYDAGLALIVMELLEPHIIMRHGMIAGRVYPRFVQDITDFMARSLYFTSDFYLSAAEKRALAGAFSGNVALCKITEDLIFTDPYRVAEGNRWTTPELDPFAARVRGDGDLKRAVSRLKLAFLDQAQALIHGDLHTGSVMLTETETRVIDPEFAFVGPMGFDLGAVLANLLISFFSQSGHEAAPGARDGYRDWILESIAAIWEGFRAKFLDLWIREPRGDGFPVSLFGGEDGQLALAIEREAFMDRLFADMLGFAGAKMIRRVLGLAHNIDLEHIKAARVRALAEARVLILARELIVNTGSFARIGAVTAAARRVDRMVPDLGA